MSTFTVTSVADAGAGTLRQAILDDNLGTGSNAIQFDIAGSGVQSIALLSPLPTIINPTTIDATTQPGYAGRPLVEIQGAGILNTTATPPTPIPNVNGLTLTGGSSSVKGLVVDRFTGSGIVATRDFNAISGDFIGTDPTGTVSLGNGGSGVALSGRNNTVGAPGAFGLNVISGNGGAGVYLGGTSSGLPTNNVVEGNYIGTDLGGTVDLGNFGPGVDIESSRNTIGVPGAENVIAYNGGAGVLVGNASYLSNIIDNRIEGNSIFSNVALGIDLGNDGVNSNFPGNNFGPNQGQTYPVLTSAFPSTIGTKIEGSLLAAPKGKFIIDFYANAQPDRTGYGQGQVPIGVTTVFTDASGFANLTTTLPTASLIGQYISATATDANGNTSEFSFSQVVTPTSTAELAVSATNSNPIVQAGTTETYFYTIRNNGPSLATNLTFQDTLPAGAVFLSGNSGQINFAPPINGVVTANLGSLASGSSTFVNLTFSLPKTGLSRNLVTVSADQSTPSMNTSITQSIQVTPASPVNLSLTGFVNPAFVQAGQPLTYTFVVSNTGFNTATNVMFADPLPRGLQVVSVRSSQGANISMGDNVMVALGDLPAASNATVTIVVTPTTPGPVANFAMISADEPVLNALNLSTTVYSYVTLPPATDVAVTITAAPQPATVGQPFSYAILVGNPGSAPATGVTLTDVLTDAATIASIKPSQGSFTLVGNVLTVNFGNLAIGALAEVTVSLIPGAPGYIVNRASVVANEPEFNIANNFSQLATPVVGEAFAPAVLDQKLNVTGNRITQAVLTFNEALDSNSASMIANYEVLDLGQNGSLSATGPKVAVTSATYNYATRSVTLTFKNGLNIGRFYKIVVNGPGAPGLIDVNGNVLDGENNGLQNSIYQSLVGRGTTTRPVDLQIGVTRPKPTPRPKPAPVHHLAVKHHH